MFLLTLKVGLFWFSFIVMFAFAFANLYHIRASGSADRGAISAKRFSTVVIELELLGSDLNLRAPP